MKTPELISKASSFTGAVEGVVIQQVGVLPEELTVHRAAASGTPSAASASTVALGGVGGPAA